VAQVQDANRSRSREARDDFGVEPAEREAATLDGWRGVIARQVVLLTLFFSKI